MAREFGNSIEDISTRPTKDLQCLSADITNLPTDVESGSICQVLDTKQVLQFHKGTSTWYEL